MYIRENVFDGLQNEFEKHTILEYFMNSNK